MRHPTEGVLRRLIDEPEGVPTSDREHVGACQGCRDQLAAVAEDAGLVEAALAADVDVDVDAAWRRLSTAATAAGPRRAAGHVRAGRARAVLRRPAAAVVAVAVVVTGASAAAANDWLQIFRTERVAPVGITTADLLELPDLSAYGELRLSGDPDVHEVPDAAAAAAESGLDVPVVRDLPQGVSGEPVHQVGGAVTATFTFSAERAAEAAEEAGEPLPPAPPGLDGSSVRLEAGPGTAQVWTSAAGVPALIVARAVAPTASSSGLPFEVVRDHLLSLPGLSEEVAAQLRTFAADGSTLPLPVPADAVTTRSDEVDGVPATVLASRNRSFAAVVWVDGGVVNVVAGSLDDDEVLAVARGSR
jgi:hypothetical protein